MFKKIFILSFLSLLACCSLVIAAPTPTPQQIQIFQSLSQEQQSALIEKYRTENTPNPVSRGNWQNQETSPPLY